MTRALGLTAKLSALAAAAALAGCGGGSPLDNADTVANPPGASGQKLSFAYFQRCINPVLNTPLRVVINGVASTNTCAAGGCHDNATGTGGALRLLAGAAAADLSLAPDTLRATDMYKNFYSSLGESVVGTPDQSRILNKPLVRGVLHGGGLIFENPDTPEAKLIRYWISRPMPQGQDEFSSAANTMFTPADPATGAVQHALKPLMGRTVHFLRWLVLWAACVGFACVACTSAQAAADDNERLQVTAPYLELHTGPGRGYPVHFVVEKQQWVTVELRHTDWYRVRTEGGQVGWVPRAQLESTLTEAGVAKSFRDLLIDDYLRRRLEFGAGWGRFKSEPMLKLWLNYRLADTVAIELGGGQVQGTFSGSDFWHVSLTSEPWSDRRLSPFLSVGLGKFRNIPNSSLVDSTVTDAKLGHATLGLRWYIAERFVARLDWSLYTAFVSDARSVEYRAVTAGLAFFF